MGCGASTSSPHTSGQLVAESPLSSDDEKEKPKKQDPDKKKKKQKKRRHFRSAFWHQTGLDVVDLHFIMTNFSRILRKKIALYYMNRDWLRGNVTQIPKS
jgi:hypothetical protein